MIAEEPRVDATRVTELAQSLEGELARLIVGQKPLVRDTVIALIVGGHVLLEGVPGLGKTVLVRSLGQTLSMSFSRIQFTPDMMPADIVGTNVISEEDGRRQFRYQAGPIFANLVLADEINRATPKTQSALLEAMQERTVTVGTQTRPLPSPFFVLATQNPIELEGTYPLPEAQLDRFFFKVLVPFPSESDLLEIARRTTGESTPQLKPVADAETVLAAQRVAREVPIAEHVLRYAARLIGATHPDRTELEAVRRYVDDVVLVTDDDILAALRDLLTFAKLVVEPAGAAGVAALLTGKVVVERGAKVAAVISGGNIDLDRLKSLL